MRVKLNRFLLRSPNDVAEVAVRVLLSPRDHYNKEFVLTGPSPITDQEVASCLSKRLEKPVMYVEQPIHTFEETIEKMGAPKWMVTDLVELEKVKASGKEDSLAFFSNDIEKICGHKAQSFEEYLQDCDTMTTAELGHTLVVTAEGAAA